MHILKINNRIKEIIFTKQAIYIALLTTAIIISNAPFLATPISLYDHDLTRHASYPDMVIIQNIKQYGEFRLWDLISGNGSPQIGQPSYFFYPLVSPLYIFFNVILTLKISIVLHLIISAYAFYYMARTLKLNPIPSLFGAFFYVTNYYVQSNVNVGVLTEIFNLIWMPLAITFLWKSLFEKKYYFTILVGFSLAMQIVAMNFYAVLFTGILLGSVTLYYLTSKFKSEGFGLFLRITKYFLTILVTTLAISSIKLLPMIEYASRSIRLGGKIYASGNPLHQGFTSLSFVDGLLFLFNLLVPTHNIFHISTFVNFAFLFFRVMTDN